MTRTVAQSREDGTVAFQQTLTMKVTDLARDKLQMFLPDGKKITDLAVRVSVQPGGCSGASYGMEFADEQQEGEIEFVANGIRLLVDPAHAPLLHGVTIDFVDEMMGGGFKLHNPNATSSCGCGKSFSA
jgi:iron-sulfur cluster assembly accessory protein